MTATGVGHGSSRGGRQPSGIQSNPFSCAHAVADFVYFILNFEREIWH